MSETAPDSPPALCTCTTPPRIDYRWDPPTETYVHTVCGRTREDAPTMASVVAFADRVIERMKRDRLTP